MSCISYQGGGDGPLGDDGNDGVSSFISCRSIRAKFMRPVESLLMLA